MIIRNRSFPIDFIPQFSGTLKRYDLSWDKDEFIPGGGISASAFPLLPYTEFPETADQHIFTGFKGSFNKRHKGFDDFKRFTSCESNFISDSIDNLGFCKCHWQASPSN